MSSSGSCRGYYMLERVEALSNEVDEVVLRDLVDCFIKTYCPLFELSWTDITKIAMSSFTVIKYLDVFKDASPRRTSRQKDQAVQFLNLQRVEERFGDRVVIAVPFAAHTLNRVCVFQSLFEVVTTVLRTLVRMKNQVG